MRIRLWLKRVVAGACLLLVVAAIAGATYQWLATRRDLAATPPPGRLVDVCGHRLHIWCTGSGAPAVVLEAGLGGSTAVWGFVQPEVAKLTQVCSYDRAGMGYSDAGPSPRTARRLAGELARLLEAGGLEGPVVVVGASVGGLIARVLASEHPDRVAGLVLVDASHESQKEDVPAVLPLMPFLATLGVPRLAGFSLGLPPESLPPAVRGWANATRFRTSGYRAAASELSHFPASAAEVKATRRRLDIPLVVVTAGRGSNDAWQDLQRDQMSLSPYGCQVVAHQSGHAIPVGQPEVVVDAIRATVGVVREARVASPCP
jgi:pimeloyl-ACP methyl ester carboxylesterase